MYQGETPMERDMKAEYYREEAERLRRKATETRDEVIRMELLGIAQQYERLAANTEYCTAASPNRRTS
jgi:hypothetical protein